MDSLKSFLTPMKLVVVAVLGIVIIGGGYFVFASNSTTTNDQATIEEHESEELMEDEDGDSMTMPVVLDEQNDSGQTGTATLTEEDGQTTVSITLDDYTEGVSQPAHLHGGSCLTLGDVLYPLTDVLDGTSDTVLDLDLATIKSELPLALNVHKSADEVSVYTSCGDLK